MMPEDHVVAELANACTQSMNRAIAQLIQRGESIDAAYAYVGSMLLGIGTGALIKREGRVKPTREWDQRIVEFVNEMVSTLPKEQPRLFRDQD